MEEQILTDALSALYNACMDILEPLYEVTEGDEVYKSFCNSLNEAQETLEKIKFG